MAFFSAPEVEWLYSGVTNTKPVQGADRLGPLLGVLVGVLTERGRQRLVKVGQVVVEQVDQLELRVGALRGELVDPLGDSFAVAPGTGTADDDSDLDHVTLLILSRLDPLWLPARFAGQRAIAAGRPSITTSMHARSSHLQTISQ